MVYFFSTAPIFLMARTYLLRHELITLLGTLDHPTVVPCLGEVVSKNKDPRLRADAARALAPRPSNGPMDALPSSHTSVSTSFSASNWRTCR